MNGSHLVDEDALRDLYLPLIRPSAYALYQTLRGDEGTLSAGHLLLRLDLTSGEFTKAIAPLEAVGLVRTFVETQGEVQLFVFCLYSPKTAKEFFDDYLLQGTLHGIVGDDAFLMLSTRYKNLSEVPDAEEISQSFPKVFNQPFPHKYYLQGSPLENVSGTADARLSFDRGAFLAKTRDLQMREDLLSEHEMEAIEKLATLYTINESLMAEYVFDSLVPNALPGNRIDFQALSSKCRLAMPFKYLKEEGKSSNLPGGTPKLDLIQEFDRMSPSQYLCGRQGGHKPAKADLRLIERLSIQLGLPDPCINVLLSYVLDKYDNVLDKDLTEKIGASLVREGCRSAKDAMDYLYRNQRKNQKQKTKGLSSPLKKEDKKIDPSEDEEEVSEEQIKRMIADYYKGDNS